MQFYHTNFRYCKVTKDDPGRNFKDILVSNRWLKTLWQTFYSKTWLISREAFLRNEKIIRAILKRKLIGDFRERVGLFVPRWRSRPQVEESVVCTRMWDEWKYGYLSKLKLHFIHAGKADTRESAFRLAVVETGRERCFCVIMAGL